MLLANRQKKGVYMEDNILIRPAKVEDSWAIRSAYCNACNKVYDGIVEPERLARVANINDKERLATVENNIRNGNIEYSVAEVDGKVGGYISISYPKVGDYPQLGDEETQKGTFEIDHLYIDPAYQGHGIGSELLYKISADKEDVGYRNLILWTVGNDPSGAFHAPSLRYYNQHGITELLDSHIGPTLGVLCYCMTRELDNTKYGKLTFSQAVDMLHEKTPEEQFSLLAGRYNIRQALQKGVTSILDENAKVIAHQDRGLDERHQRIIFSQVIDVLHGKNPEAQMDLLRNQSAARLALQEEIASASDAAKKISLVCHQRENIRPTSTNSIGR